MTRRRSRIKLHQVFLGVGAAAVLLGGLIVWLGARRVAEIRQLAERGEVAEGTYLRTQYGTCKGTTNRTDCSDDTAFFAYTVSGKRYEVATNVSATGREAVFKGQKIENSRFGPYHTGQVIYLPNAPATAVMRSDLDVSMGPMYATGGMFAFIGIVFMAAARFLLWPKRRR